VAAFVAGAARRQATWPSPPNAVASNTYGAENGDGDGGVFELVVSCASKDGDGDVGDSDGDRMTVMGTAVIELLP
jgi:hypothetical protein